MRTNLLQAQGFYLGSCSNSLKDLPAYIYYESLNINFASFKNIHNIMGI